MAGWRTKSRSTQCDDWSNKKTTRCTNCTSHSCPHHGRGSPISTIGLPRTCVRSLPEGWTFGAGNIRNGWSKFTLDHDRLGAPAVVVRLTATCNTTGAIPTPSDQPGTQRFERRNPAPVSSWYVFPGGCVTIQFRSTGNGDASLVDQAASAVGFSTRRALQQALDERSNGHLHLDPADAKGPSLGG